MASSEIAAMVRDRWEAVMTRAPSGWHLHLYPTGRDDALPRERRIGIVEGRWPTSRRSAPPSSGARDRDREVIYVVLNDPEGNEFLRRRLWARIG